MIPKNKLHLVGVVGGMGPLSSVQFYNDLISYCQKELDIFYNKDYPHILISNLPVPDLIKGTNQNSISREMVINEMKKMEKMGAEAIAMACNTMHLYIDEFKKAVNIPVLNILEESAFELKRKGKRKVGILATPTTINHKLYQEALRASGIDFVVPTEEQTKDLGEMILLTLGGKETQKEVNKLKKIINSMVDQKVDSILFGCTELGILIKEAKIDTEIVNSITVLAKSVADISLGIRKI